MITVPIDALRTLDEVLESLKKNYPEHYPVTETTRKEINPAILPTGVINKIWNIT